MATDALNRVVAHLRRTAIGQEGAGAADGDLLECFIKRRDQQAFETLLRRHGPMVLGVCRRILGRNEADAEDAFQATFLVLVRKANSIRPRGMVGNWLFGVAQNTALKAKAMIHKRRVKEREAGTLPKSVAAEEVWQQVQRLLDEELGRLPDKYRVSIVLCDLEGKTIKEAARHLGWPQETVATRLAQGRRLLAKRLSKHGLTLSGGALAALLSQGAVSAVVPVPLVLSTAKAASVLAAGQTAASGLISAKVATLMEGAVKAMFLTKLKIAMATALVAIVLWAGGSMLCRTTSAAAAPQAESAAQGSGENEPGRADKKQNQPASGADGVETYVGTQVPLYELHVQVLIGVTEIKKHSMVLKMTVPGKVRIFDGSAVPNVRNRDQLGIFLGATVVGENVKGVLTELALDDIGLVDGKADIKRLYSDKHLGKVQGFSFDSRELPGQLTINVTVQRLGSGTDSPLHPPGPNLLEPQFSTQPKSGKQVFKDLSPEELNKLKPDAGAGAARLFKNEGEESRASFPNSLQSVTPKSYDGDPTDYLWHVLGLEVRKTAESQLTKTNKGLRGGVRVTNVRPQGPAAAVIQRGDILVGLDVWETLDAQACAFVLQQCDKHKSKSVKYHVVRDGTLLTGTLALAYPSVEESPKSYLTPKVEEPIGPSQGDSRDQAPLYVLQVQLIQEGLERTAADKAYKDPIEAGADHARIHRDVRDIRTLQMALPLGVPGKVQIIPGGAALGNAKREFLGVFLKATVLAGNAKNVKIELTVDNVGLVDGKADIQRLFSTKQSGPLGEVQECSVNPKTLSGRLTIKVTVQLLEGPQTLRPATKQDPNKGDNLLSPQPGSTENSNKADNLLSTQPSSPPLQSKSKVGAVGGLIEIDGNLDVDQEHYKLEGAADKPLVAPLEGAADRPLVAPLESAAEKPLATPVTVSQPVQRKVAPFEDFTGRLVAVGPVALSDPAGPLKPIGVRFDMDERSYLRYQRLSKGQLKGAGHPLAVGLSDENSFPRAGVLDHFETEFKARTGTIGVHGVLPNADGLLLPGMFVRVRMPFGPPRPVLEVPDEAVGLEQGQPYLWVASKNIVDRRAVRPGAMDGSMRIIEEGLRPEDLVITAGAKGLKPGDHVELQFANQTR